MAKAPEKHEDLSERFKKLSLNGIKQLALELGSGAYGKVYQVKYRGVKCAAKEVHSTLLDNADSKKLLESFEREFIRCSELSHPNIVKFMGVYYPSPVSLPVIVMELMDESLTKYLEESNISLKRRIAILHHVAEGMIYLHTCTPPVIHGDLSPNNILLLHTGVEQVPPIAKVADLGVANVMQTVAKNQLTKVPGAFDFMPPEVFVDNPKYGPSLDVFSYGGIMLYTVNQEWPTPKPPTKFDPVTSEKKGLREVERHQEYIDKLTGEAEVLRQLIETCLDNDPTKRPPMTHLAEMIKPLKVCNICSVSNS